MGTTYGAGTIFKRGSIWYVSYCVDGQQFIAVAKFLLALKLFELGRLSSSRATDLCGMNRVDFLLRAGQPGSPVTDLDEREAEEFSSLAFSSPRTPVIVKRGNQWQRH